MARWTSCELSSGIHPAILAEGGLAPALRTLARRSAVPVEVAAYYVVSEALTTPPSTRVSMLAVDVEAEDRVLRVWVRETGWAAPTWRGSGLVGLTDRIEATGGTMRVESRPGQGTSLLAELPINAGQLSELRLAWLLGIGLSFAVDAILGRRRRPLTSHLRALCGRRMDAIAAGRSCGRRNRVLATAAGVRAARPATPRCRG
jgi:hypothetical protein